MKNNIKKIAFTLAEVVTVLTITGFLAVIVLSTLSKITPDKNKVMFIKAYTTTEKIITETVKDETLYPHKAGSYGFKNTDAVYAIDNPDKIFGGKIGEANENTKRNRKFAEIFAYKLNAVGTSSTSCKITTVSQKVNGIGYDGTYKKPAGGDRSGCIEITTTDGIVWDIPVTSFNYNSGVTHGRIYIDTNGLDNAPNQPTKDRFMIIVYSNGKVSVSEGSTEEKYLMSDDFKKED